MPQARQRQRWLSLAAGGLALPLGGVATPSRTWHALEVNTFYGMTAPAGPQSWGGARPRPPLSGGVARRLREA